MTRFHVSEKILSTTSAGSRGYHAAILTQFYRHPTNASFTSIKGATCIQVVKDHSTDRSYLLITEVGGRTTTRGNGNRNHIGRRAGVLVQIGFLHRVGTCLHIVEAIGAVASRRGCAFVSTIHIAQRNGDASNTQLTSALHAIAIQVMIDLTTDGGD